MSGWDALRQLAIADLRFERRGGLSRGGLPRGGPVRRKMREGPQSARLRPRRNAVSWGRAATFGHGVLVPLHANRVAPSLG